MSPRRSLLERLATPRPLIGLLQTHPNPSFAEMAGMCGYDFLMLDGEHGVFSESDYLAALQALAAADVAAMVRLGKQDPQAVGRYLDLGVDAIVAPNVTVPEEAKALALAMLYPPAGTRGFAASLHRTTHYGLKLAEHLEAPRKGTCLFVLIESALGASNVEEILAVDGVDGVIIGPWDLSADLGGPGDFDRPAFSQALTRIERAAIAQKKILGTAPHSGSPADALVSRGHRLLIVGADMSLLREAMSTLLSSTATQTQR